MALFVVWQDMAAQGRPADRLYPLLAAQAHVEAEKVHTGTAGGASGHWHYAAFATRTHFYTPEQQHWARDGQGACILHGLAWRVEQGRPRLLDAEAIAALLDRPGATLPDDVCGEYAIVRIWPDGSLIAQSDHAGLHQIFHAASGAPALSNRASLVATLLDDRAPDPAGLRWLAAIGYRVGTATAFASVRQLGQEMALHGEGGRLEARPARDPIITLGGARGWSADLGAALDAGVAQAQAAIALGIPAEGPVDLPITGGKDSRVILALCLAAGLRDRLTLFTRGYAGHPDVVAGAGIAAALGLPHRREAPHGSDEPAYWTRDRFFAKLAAQAWQSDAMVGGWDLILGERPGTGTIVSGHMGEVLKAYSKKALPEGPLDPAAMVRLQAPFDPMGLFRPEARAALEAELAAQMERARGEGATEADLPDIFYYRNRIPNWLGAIRAIKSFERQPVVPLGAPALLRLAFRLTPEERKQERLHYEIIRRCAPELLGLPFALQGWDPALGEDVPRPDPILPAPGMAVFGNWQFSLNHNAGIRAALVAEVEARGDLGLWQSIDRDALLDRLRHHRLDYFDGISMLGLVIAMFHESGLERPAKLTADGPGGGAPVVLSTAIEPPGVAGHLDGVGHEDGVVTFGGWAHAPAWPGAQPALEVRVDGRALAIGAAAGNRPDLIPHGIGDGRHGFRLTVPRELLGEDEVDVTIAAFDGEAELARVTVKP